MNYFASVREPVDAVEDEEEERGDDQEEAVNMDVVVAAVTLKNTIKTQILIIGDQHRSGGPRY